MWKIAQAEYTCGAFFYPIFMEKDGRRISGGLCQTLRDAVAKVRKFNGDDPDGNNAGPEGQTRMA